MKKVLTMAIIALLILAALAIAQDGGRGRSRVSVNSMGWRAEIDALKAEVAILKAQVADLQAREQTLRSGQLFFTEWEYSELNANRIEAAGHTPERMFWVCDIDELTGAKQIPRDEYTTKADLALEWMRLQAINLQP